MEDGVEVESQQNHLAQGAGRMEVLKEDLSSAVEDLARKVGEAEGIVWVGIVGIPGAGKSSTSELAKEMLRERFAVQSQVVPMDGYHYSKAELDKFENPEEAHFRRGAPFTFDSPAFVRDLERCRTEPNEKHFFPSWDHSKGDPGPRDILVDGNIHRVVFVEGNYLLLKHPEPWPKLVSLFDETWFLKVEVDVAVERVAKRNALAFGWSYERTLERTLRSDKLNMEEILSHEPEKLASRVLRNNI